MDPIKKIWFAGMESSFLCSFILFWARGSKILLVPLLEFSRGREGGIWILTLKTPVKREQLWWRPGHWKRRPACKQAVMFHSTPWDNGSVPLAKPPPTWSCSSLLPAQHLGSSSPNFLLPDTSPVFYLTRFFCPSFVRDINIPLSANNRKNRISLIVGTGMVM